MVSFISDHPGMFSPDKIAPLSPDNRITVKLINNSAIVISVQQLMDSALLCQFHNSVFAEIWSFLFPFLSRPFNDNTISEFHDV